MSTDSSSNSYSLFGKPVSTRDASANAFTSSFSSYLDSSANRLPYSPSSAKANASVTGSTIYSSSTSTSDSTSAKKDKMHTDYIGFTISAVTNFLCILIFFVIFGSISLYTCKVAQSNILPSDIRFSPFTNISRQFSYPDEVSINPVKVYDNYWFQLLGIFESGVYSTKVKFDEDKNYNTKSKFSFIEFLNSMSRANFFGHFVRDICANMISNMNLWMNTFYQIINQYLPESLIIVFFPIFSMILAPVLAIGSFLLAGFYNVWYIRDFFQYKTRENKWEDPFTYIQPIRIWFLCMYFFFLWLPFMILVPPIITFYVTFVPLFITCETTSTNAPKKTIGLIDFMMNTLKYKSQLYIILTSLVLLFRSGGQIAFWAILVGSLVLSLLLSGSISKETILQDKYVTEGVTSSAPIEVTNTTVGGGMKGGLRNRSGMRKNKVGQKRV